MAAIGPVPFAAMMLGDMGAQITRIDRVPNGRDTSSPGFENRGRASIAVDLKKPRAAEVVLSLIEGADVLLEGFRPGVMEKLGFSPDTCLARNPGLIYGRMTGWGQTGPLARAAGHDINYIALTGALHAMGWKDRPPMPPLNLLGDYGGGAMMLLVGILAALYERERSGQGQVIDAAMSDGVAALMSPIYSMMAQHMWKDTRSANMLDGGAHYYGVYECADGRFVSIGSIEPAFYALLLQKCGLDAPEFLRQHDAKQWPELREKLEALFKTRTRDQWCALMEGTDVCFAPVLNITEAADHPHNQERATFTKVNGVTQPAPAPRFSRTPSRVSADIPMDGEHSAELLESAGWSGSDIAELVADGVVYAKTPPAPVELRAARTA